VNSDTFFWALLYYIERKGILKMFEFPRTGIHLNFFGVNIIRKFRIKVICPKFHESDLHPADFLNFLHFGLGSKIKQKNLCLKKN